MAFRQQEIETENFTPRPFQLELVDKAKSENLIIPLPTGTGKTFIAIMLIREFAETMRVPYDKGGKRAFFLVDKVSLGAQQAQELRTHTDLNISEYSGGRNCDRWTSDRWERELGEFEVFVMTAQIFLNILSHGFFQMDRACVIVFDECHHATGEHHPYREIMRDYAACKQKPRILGLTASIVNERTTPAGLERIMYVLECALSSKIETTSDRLTASKYGAKPTMTAVKCQDFDRVRAQFQPIRRVLERALDFCITADFNPEFEMDPRHLVKTQLKRVLTVLDQLGPWCAYRTCGFIDRVLVKYDKYRWDEIGQLFVLMCQTTVRMAMMMLEPHVSGVDSLEKLLPLLPHRVHRLLECLRGMNPRKRQLQTTTTTTEEKPPALAAVGVSKRQQRDENEFAGLVFVQQRYIAKMLKDLLKTVQKFAKDDYGYLKIDFVVGGSGQNAAEDEHRLRKLQEDALRNFRQKHLNLLVATSVLEEGLDIRHCNCVIRFDLPQDFRAYIQSKGRARKQNSRYIILVDDKDYDAFYVRYKQFQRIEKILLHHCHSRQVPPKEDIDMLHANEIMPPYYAPAVGNEPLEGRPRVTMTTAVSLINRYCAKLPSDLFTRLTPRYDVKFNKETSLYEGSLMLPINSPIKQKIFGPPMPSQKYAQMATALAACQVLHEHQELDRHLLPVGKESAAKFLILDDSDEALNTGDSRVRPGSTKRKQYYTKKVADAFTDAKPTSDSPNYVHVIEIELLKPDEGGGLVFGKAAHVMNHPSQFPRVWGILSKKPLAKIPSFPLFARQGELRVRIHTLPFTVQLDPDQLALITRFHEYLFMGVLRLEKYSMKFDPASSKYAFNIVPLKKVDPDIGFVLDFPFVKNIADTVGNLPHIPSEDEREVFQFARERYMDAVVIPWYRNPEQPYFYIVTDIRDHLHPSSPFPDAEYGSFNDYFMQKYGLHIYNQEQSMLDVDYTSNKLNLTLPRPSRRTHASQTSQKAQSSNGKQDAAASFALSQKQLLAPELVDIHPIPASMWNMIVCLPTVLYRVNSLLVAEEWRDRVEKEAFHRSEPIPGVFSWEPWVYSGRRKGSGGGGSDYADDESISSDLERSRARNNAAADAANAAAAAADTFEIGVWDPNLVADDNNVVTANYAAAAAAAGHPPNGLITAASAATDQSSSASSAVINPADEDWDDEDEIYFDVELSRRFMNLERRATSGGVNGETKFHDPFAPSANIVPTGWDSGGMDVSSENGGAGGLGGVNCAAGVVPGLSFLSSDGQFDANALLNDIAKFGGPNPNPTPNPNQTNPNAYNTPASQTAAAVGGSNRAARSRPMTAVGNRGGIEDEEWDEGEGGGGRDGGGSTQNKRRKRRQRLLIDPVGFEDVDERRVEESIDLADLGIDERNLSPIPADCGRKSSGGVDLRVYESDAPIIDGSVPAPAADNNSNGVVSGDGDTNNKATDFGDDDDISTIADAIIGDNDPFDSSSHDQVQQQQQSLLASSTAFDFEAEYFNSNPFGPNPCLILQALTMSNANDGINLERLETVGDSFLKYAVTNCLFNACPDFHEGKLSFLRSKHVSNYNLYKLGKRKGLGEIMVACKFEPNDNWLPPGCCPLEKDAENVGVEEDDKQLETVLEAPPEVDRDRIANGDEKMEVDLLRQQQKPIWPKPEELAGVIPYNLLTQHSIPDKSIADAVEAMIGVYLITYGPRKAIEFLKWLGVKPAPDEETWYKRPREPLLNFVDHPIKELGILWRRFNFKNFESEIGYVFHDKAHLVQAFTHASYSYNRVTDCYQRLEFLGDAVLDYLITRHLYEDKRQHSPGVLTDLRSALVNNTIFASLAVKYKFHKYFMALCPAMSELMKKFVQMIEERRDESNFDEELYLLNEEDCDEQEDIEVPKALGDMFESVAGAIYLDSGGSLNAVWRVYYRMMEKQIEKCCAKPPKSPIRELMELEPDRAKFSKWERDMVDCKVRVVVDVAGKGRFTGVGRNYRIAKCTAAKRALKCLKLMKAREASEAAAIIQKR